MQIGNRSTLIAVILVLLSVGTGPATAEDWAQWGGNGHYYKPVTAPGGISWDDAQADAVSQGGYLATIASEAENEFVFSLIEDPEYWNFDSYVCGPWIGGFQPPGTPEPAEGWEWVSGEPFTYTNWYPDQPDDGGGEDYLHFWGNPPSSAWNDLNQSAIPVVGYVIESVPEPATLMLLAVGGLLVTERRRDTSR